MPVRYEFHYTRARLPRWLNLDNHTAYDRFMGTYVTLTVNPEHSPARQNKHAMEVVDALNRIYQ